MSISRPIDMSLPDLPLLITAGEPAGIGPDLLVQYAQQARDIDCVVLCDCSVLQQRAALLGLPLQCLPYQRGKAVAREAGQLSVWHLPVQQAVTPGVLAVSNAQYVHDMLACAAEAMAQAEFSAVVTAPVQKSLLNDAGIIFSGHTEFFQQRAGVDRVVMLLACPGLRVALATTHLPLRSVPDAITAELLTEILQILLADLRSKFALAQPRILVAGLNPHAGEGGHMGHEEIDVIIPVLQHFRAQGHDIVGPLPADTLFTPHHLQQADAVLAMYHDQGLPVLKHKGFGQAVNITLGLPWIRTSVDHGTALDLAGSGRADGGSLMAAIACAREMVQAQACKPQPGIVESGNP